ncbi:hypothetical protein JOC54_002300 [Alkalihalobacillus xiaoxiensis]|uniref:Uncharacterized protein n=1 Tax=Shouchella xiaoxiensis TaxID=766895 RepID=A0ABS2SUV4_9BACI|nr:hypothetical protein [Shouchella xiaoxiensis]MBM7839030.1 hypothetical protein [Shouchella xiaoxiensis]
MEIGRSSLGKMQLKQLIWTNGLFITVLAFLLLLVRLSAGKELIQMALIGIWVLIVLFSLLSLLIKQNLFQLLASLKEREQKPVPLRRSHMLGAITLLAISSISTIVFTMPFLNQSIEMTISYYLITIAFLIVLLFLLNTAGLLQFVRFTGLAQTRRGKYIVIALMSCPVLVISLLLFAFVTFA